WMQREAVSGKEGFFSLKNLEPGGYSITAWLDNKDGGASRTLKKRVTLGSWGEVRCDFAFDSVGSIRGRVFLFDEPVSKARISVYSSRKAEDGVDRDVSHSSRTETDEDGYFEATRLPAGLYHVSASVNRKEQRFSATQKVEVVNAEAEVDIRLGELMSCEVYGNFFKDGMPFTGQQVRLSANSFSATTKTDGNGYYHFMDVPPGNVHIHSYIQSDYSGTVDISRRLKMEAGDATRVDLSFTKGSGSICGEVTIRPETNMKTRIYIAPTGEDLDQRCSYSCWVEQGRYRLDDLLPGMYTVSVYEPWRKAMVVQVSSGRSAQADFEYKSGNAGISGTVTAPDDRDKERVAVYLFEPGSCPWETGKTFQEVSFSQGLVAEMALDHGEGFHFNNLPAGLIDVVCVRYKDKKTIKLDLRRVKLYEGDSSQVNLSVLD
ncbi:MAG: carboxypeptidase-like regulatory domain-containing protein, partial [Planctomycetota bacterium]